MLFDYARGNYSWIYPVTLAVPWDGLVGKSRCLWDEAAGVRGRPGVCIVAIDLAVRGCARADDDVEASLFYAHGDAFICCICIGLHGG